MTSQVCTDETVAKASGNLRLAPDTSLEMSKNKEKGNCPNTWAVKLSLSFSPMASFAPFPLPPCSHSFDDSSSCQCLPCPITGHWLRACWPSPRPSFSFSKPVFQPSSFFFPFQWLNRDQEAVRYTEAQLAKEKGECPGELSMSITSDYLQFYPEDFEGKASNGTLPAMFTQCETSMSVFNFENVPRGLSPYQKWPHVIAWNQTFWLLCLYLCMYITVCRWHMLSSSAALKLKVKAKCWKTCWWQAGILMLQL